MAVVLRGYYVTKYRHLARMHRTVDCLRRVRFIENEGLGHIDVSEACHLHEGPRPARHNERNCRGSHIVHKLSGSRAWINCGVGKAIDAWILANLGSEPGSPAFQDSGHVRFKLAAQGRRQWWRIANRTLGECDDGDDRDDPSKGLGCQLRTMIS